MAMQLIQVEVDLQNHNTVSTLHQAIQDTTKTYKKLTTSNLESMLVIGYGNLLRSDDGAGCRVADIVASWELPYMRSLSVHQLTPELAEPIAQSDLVIFVDACVRNNGLPDHDLNAGIGHLSDPRSLLLLAQQVYGKTPVAYALLLPAVNWEFGEQISDITAKGIEQAVDFLRTLCTKLA